MSENKDTEKAQVKKMLGALVPEDLFWEFKKAASERKEEMQEAIMHAALLYLDIVKGGCKDGQK